MSWTKLRLIVLMVATLAAVSVLPAFGQEAPPPPPDTPYVVPPQAPTAPVPAPAVPTPAVKPWETRTGDEEAARQVLTGELERRIMARIQQMARVDEAQIRVIIRSEIARQIAPLRKELERLSKADAGAHRQLDKHIGQLADLVRAQPKPLNEEQTREAVIAALVKYGAIKPGDLDTLTSQIRTIVREEVRTALPALTPAPAPTPTPTPTPSATGTVIVRTFVDQNGNKTRDSGEPSQSNVKVSLTGPVSRDDFTDADGKREFKDLPVGDYTVRMDVPSGYVATTDVSQPVKLGTGEMKEVSFGSRLLQRGIDWNKQYLRIPLWGWLLIVAAVVAFVLTGLGAIAIPVWVLIAAAVVVMLLILYVPVR